MADPSRGTWFHDNNYDIPDPFTVTEMEEIGVASAVKQMGMTDRLIIIRNSINMDVFMLGNTLESLWNTDNKDHLASDDNIEAADIFSTAMENNFCAGELIIQAIMDGKL